MNYKVGAFVDTGLDHIKRGEVCQDAVLAVSNGDLFLIAVSDGAGSARKSQIGSSLLLECIHNKFGSLSPLLETSETVLKDLLIAGVEDFRCACASYDDDSELSDFACTLVGVVGISSGIMLSFHLGDGAIIAFRDSECLLLSSPENGEYSNETFFVTMDSWREHLRLNVESVPLACIMVMTDGVTPFALTSSGPFIKFLQPLYKFICDNKEVEIQAGLHSTLSGERAQSICRDDKALSWVLIGEE